MSDRLALSEPVADGAVHRNLNPGLHRLGKTLDIGCVLHFVSVDLLPATFGPQFALELFHFLLHTSRLLLNSFIAFEEALFELHGNLSQFLAQIYRLCL